MCAREWHKDLEQSQKNFQNIIWPELNKVLPGKLEPVEGSDRPQDLDIDRQSGVDYWWVQDGAGRTAISSRVQPDDGRKGFPYDTFTIRKSRLTGSKTEYQKLIEARENRRLYPAVMVHGYITQKDKASLVSLGIAYTDKILDYIASGKARTKPTTNADFYIVPFDAVAHYRWPEKSVKNNPREVLIRKIAQCHLNPGWSTTRQAELFRKYSIATVESWDNLTTEELETIATEIIKLP